MSSRRMINLSARRGSRDEILNGPIPGICISFSGALASRSSVALLEAKKKVIQQRGFGA